VTINYARLPFGLRRPRITSKTPQYGLWDKTGDWAQDGLAYTNIYWNYGEFLNDWSSGELSDELTRKLYHHPQDWGFCGYCSEGPNGDQDGFIRLKDWSDPDAHPLLDSHEDNEAHLLQIANVPTPRKDYVISNNQMDIWWPFYHLTGPTGLAEMDYIDLENQVSRSFRNPDNIYPFPSRMWWYFEPQHQRNENSDSITYRFDRDRFLEDVKKVMAKANKSDPSRPLTPSADQMAIIDSFSNYDSVLDISKKEISTPALGRTISVINYRVVKNPDKNAECIMPGCNGKIKRGDTWEKVCKNPLMIQ
jgi:hypothetical protein